MTSPISNESFLQWDPAQVSMYMKSIPQLDKSEIGDAFLDNNIDGSLLVFITTDHLKEIGITSLHTRLVIKKAINELVLSNHEKHPPNTMHDLDHKLHNININSNYTTTESLKLSMVLVKEIMKRISVEMHTNSNGSSVANLQTQEEVKRLNDNYIKLKYDLNQVIKVVKDAKPLPTPTLDPNANLFAESPGYLSYLGEMEQERSGLSRSNSSGTSHASPLASTAGQRDSTNLASPTFSKRFSHGSLLSMGTGKIISQTVPKYNEPKLSTDFALQNPSISSSTNRMETSKSENSAGFNRPRLGNTGSSSGGTPTLVNTGLGNNQTAPSLLKQSTQPSGSISGNAIMHSQGTLRQQSSGSSSSGSEPLKQLRASTDDSCLKILQQAMRRHHIPQEDWSKYVLVICYGDKERILKLAEKPVVVFKGLQELGKHPAIMLRQLADTKAEQESGLYEDSRIGSDIPGGML
ncbi:Protein STE50 [Spathaspora sp. JA1]|nr:Protein STE50 [Spathaspora sp. JA1]